MSTEFHTVNGPCSNLVPSGPGYEGISLANQVCPIVGAEPGQENVVGQRYVGLSFGYEFGHVWRVSIFNKETLSSWTNRAPELCNLVCLWCILHSLSPLFHRIQHLSLELHVRYTVQARIKVRRNSRSSYGRWK